MTQRIAEFTRTTRETTIAVRLVLDGKGQSEVDTGIGFLDHLFQSLACHARFDLSLSCKGDVHIDDHHSAEDCGIALGETLAKALGERRGIRRFGSAYAPLDEALARAVVDLSGRPYASIHLNLERDTIGGLACENIPHLITSLATHAGASIHLDVLKGANDHHRAEAAFKALALALRQAVSQEANDAVPSTKGVL